MKNKRGASLLRRGALTGALAAVLFLAGCHEIKGGGWMAGTAGGKATFAVNAKCVEQELFPGSGDLFTFHEGQFQYHDKGVGVSFHGSFNAWIGGDAGESCEENVEISGDPVNEALMLGECVSRPGGVVGTYSVILADNGTPGAVAGDEITIITPSFFGGPPCTDTGLPYSNSGPIGGGNISSVGHKD